MRWSIVYVELLLALTAGLTHASQYSRDESNEDSNTQFNLASTFKGGITSNRHHERARLNSQLYPDLRQQQSDSLDIDAPSAHESGGSGVGIFDARPGPYGIAVGIPQQQPVGYPNYPALPTAGQPQSGLYPVPQSSPAICGRLTPGAAPNSVPNGCQQPIPGQAQLPASFPHGYSHNTNPQATAHTGSNPPGVYPSFGAHQPGYQPVQPGYPYPGQYLPQYPSYPPTAPFPHYSGVPGNVPVVTHPGAPPISYQNQHNYGPHASPGQRDRWGHSFKMKTEYTEDGVHKGPFDVLNNHGSQGYGSGFGGGYNGPFSRPGY